MLVRTIKAFLRDESGATAIEYALLGTLIAVALVGTIAAFGDSLGNLFNSGAADVFAAQSDKID